MAGSAPDIENAERHLRLFELPVNVSVLISGAACLSSSCLLRRADVPVDDVKGDPIAAIKNVAETLAVSATSVGAAMTGSLALTHASLIGARAKRPAKVATNLLTFARQDKPVRFAPSWPIHSPRLRRPSA